MPDFIPEDPNNPDVLPQDASPAATPVAPTAAKPPATPTNPPGEHGLGLEARMSEPPDFIPEDPDNPEELPDSIGAEFGTGQQRRIGLEESLGRGMLGPVYTGAEKLLGVDPERIRLRQEAGDGLNTAAEIAGFITPGGLEAAALGKIGKGAQVVAGLGNVAKESSVIAKTAAGAVRMSAELAALQGGDEATKAIVHDPHQTAASAALNVGLAAVLGTIPGGAFAAVPAIWTKTAGPGVEKILSKIKMDWGLGDAVKPDGQVLSPWLRNVLSIFGGVGKEDIDKYVANSHEIAAAPEFNDVYGHALEQITDIQEALDQKKLNYQDAKGKFEDFVKEQRALLRQKGYDVGAADTLAREAFKQAQTRLASGLQEQALDAAPKAFSAVQKLKDKAIEMSQSARDILESTEGSLSLKPVFEAIRPMQDKLYSQGFPHLAEELGKQMDIFAHQYGEKIPYADAKSMIQGLQQRGKWQFGANEFANGLAPYFNQLSGIMNGALKKAVPEYEKAMLPTADAFGLLDKLDRYATPEAANKAALSLKMPANFANEMPALKKLEEMTGVNFTHQLEHYANPSVREAMEKALPEWGSAQKAAEALQAIKDPATREAMEKAAYLSKEYQALKRSGKSLEFGELRKEALKGLTPASLEGRMKSVMNGRSIHGRAALQGLEGMQDMSIPDILDLIATREAFEKGATNGSRNVNLFAGIGKGIGGVAGGMLGYMTGHSLPEIGALGWLGHGIGSVIGGTVDKEGPALVKNYLDKIVDKYGDLPKAVGASSDATKAGLLHFLGKDVPPDPAGFKAAINYVQAAKRGMRALKDASKAVFEGGKVLPSHLMPDQYKTEKANEGAKKLQVHQQGAFNLDGGVGRYLPEHGAALAQQAARAVTMINTHRPGPTKLAPLDPEMPPLPHEQREFDRGLQIAQQPLVALYFLKEGTLSPKDVMVLRALHPRYAQQIANSSLEAANDHLSKGGKIPYELRQSLSLLTGMNLDSSLHQPNIMAAQMVFAQQNAMKQAAVGKTQKLSKAGDAHMTRDQAVLAHSKKA